MGAVRGAARRSEQDLQDAFAPFGYTMYHVVDDVPFVPATSIAGDPTYAHLMWLFLPEPATQESGTGSGAGAPRCRSADRP